MSTVSEKIKDRLNYYLDKGLDSKMEIYNLVSEDLHVPRPSVRRVARDLRTELLEKIQILQGDG